MKRAAIFSFSRRGGELAARLSAGLKDEYICEMLSPRGNLCALAAEKFSCADALIFVGACGIAVRAIAPCVADKKRDPAVAVLDERGKFAISLLSGHMGGANALAKRLARISGGQAVVTTATDVNGRFSVDTWAAEQGLWIEDMALAKRFSAEILERDLPLASEFPLLEQLPSGLYPGKDGALGLLISCKKDAPFEKTLRLVPPILHLGIGCKRGTEAAVIARRVDEVLKDAGLMKQAVKQVASIDIKAREAGLNQYCAQEGFPGAFYSAAELQSVSGDFSESEFVRETVGVGNVCERAALLSAGAGGKLIVKKRGGDGVTVAVAREDWRLEFE